MHFSNHKATAETRGVLTTELLYRKLENIARITDKNLLLINIIKTKDNSMKDLVTKRQMHV